MLRMAERLSCELTSAAREIKREREYRLREHKSFIEHYERLAAQRERDMRIARNAVCRADWRRAKARLGGPNAAALPDDRPALPARQIDLCQFCSPHSGRSELPSLPSHPHPWWRRGLSIATAASLAERAEHARSIPRAGDQRASLNSPRRRFPGGAFLCSIPTGLSRHPAGRMMGRCI